MSWREVFRDYAEVSRGNNSFGIMDGGLEAAIRETLGPAIEHRVRAVLGEKHHGELHVGGAQIVETGDDRWPALIFAPTMPVPAVVRREWKILTSKD